MEPIWLAAVFGVTIRMTCSAKLFFLPRSGSSNLKVRDDAMKRDWGGGVCKELFINLNCSGPPFLLPLLLPLSLSLFLPLI